LKVLEVNDVSSTGALFTRGLRALGHEAELFQPTIGTYRRSVAFRSLIPIIRTAESLKMRRLFENERFDRLHIHYESFGYMGIMARVPYYLHCHGGMVTHEHRPLSWAVIKRSLAMARRVFYATPNLGDHISRFRSDAVFIPNPVDTDFFAPGPVARTSQRFRVLCISKMDATKGWDLLEDVVVKLARHPKRPEVLVFGFGAEHRNVIRRRVEQLIRNGATILPRLTRDGMRLMLRSVDMVLGQLQTGAMGMSELEALACGKVVCCRFDYDDSYPVKAPVFNARNVSEAVGVVEGLIDNGADIDRRGRSGREWVVKHHALNVCAARLVAELSI
jgi:glycosyltransferase involved in cell wall biosynthesis